MRRCVEFEGWEMDLCGIVATKRGALEVGVMFAG